MDAHKEVWLPDLAASFPTHRHLIEFFDLAGALVSHRACNWSGSAACRWALLSPGLHIGNFSSIFQLFEDRIVIAPDWALAWKEFGAFEITRAEILRYRAPFTSADIQRPAQFAVEWSNSKGRASHPKRIVGRCEENPTNTYSRLIDLTKQGCLTLRLHAALRPIRISHLCHGCM